MEKTGFRILLGASILCLGMYIGVGVSLGNWIPTGWLLCALVSLATLWVGYLLGRSDGK